MRFFIFLFFIILNGCSVVKTVAPDHYEKDEFELKVVKKGGKLHITCPEGYTDGKKFKDIIEDHVIEINKKGIYKKTEYDIDCKKNGGTNRTTNLKDIIDKTKHIIDKIGQDGKYEEVVFIIHGGLTDRASGMQSALLSALLSALAIEKENEYFDADKTGKKYPIFINWETSALRTYSDQLLNIRQGKIEPTLAEITSPFALLSHIGTGIADILSFGALEGYRIYEAFDHRELNYCSDFLTDSSKANDVYGYSGINIICPDISGNKFTDYFDYKFIPSYIGSLPVRLITGPMVIGMDRAGWENMVRRTINPLWRDYEIDCSKEEHKKTRDCIGYENKTKKVKRRMLLESDLYKFFNAFDCDENENISHCHKCEGRKNFVPISMIGHSMGTILINNILYTFPHFDYKNIVYMAAAANIRDFYNTTIPIIKTQSRSHPHPMKFYNLTMLPLYESLETSYKGLVPTGSLLEWIDEMYEQPTSQLDRTMGKWRNVREVLRAFEKKGGDQLTSEKGEKLINIRVYGTKPGQPFTHGQFNDFDKCFWRESFWTKKDKEWGKDHYCNCELIIRAVVENSSEKIIPSPQNLKSCEEKYNEEPKH